MGAESLGELGSQSLKVVSGKVVDQARFAERYDSERAGCKVVSERGRPNIAGVPLLLFRGKKVIA